MQLNGKEGLKSLNHYLYLEFTANKDNIYINDHIAHIVVVYISLQIMSNCGTPVYDVAYLLKIRLL